MADVGMASLSRTLRSRWRRLLLALRARLIAILPERAVRLLKLLRDGPALLRELLGSSRRAQVESARREVEWLTARPLISLVMPTYKPELRYLRDAVASVIDQAYAEWELVIIDDGSEDRQLTRALQGFAARDGRVKAESLPRNEGIAAATNRGLELCSGEFVGFLDHDDTLTPDALLRVAQTLEADLELDVVYSDSDKLSAKGRRADPFLKPDWSPVYALGAMYIGHLLVLRRSLADEVGGFDPSFDKIQDFEFMLRVSERTSRIAHIPQILYHWRAIPGSIAAGAEEKSGVPELQAKAVSAHLERRRIGAIAEPHPEIPHRAVLAPANGGPLGQVSVVISARDGEPLRRLGDSLARLRPAPLETIVVAGWEAELPPDAEGAWSRLERVPGPLAQGAVNAAARGARGSHLLFLSEDCELTEPNSLDLLLLHLALPGVGAVGPLLVRPDGLVEEAGVAIGLDGVADPIDHGLPAASDGYYGSLSCAHEVAAVSADALLVRREDFEQAGGFNELYLSQFADYELCQRLAARGLRTVYAPRPRVVLRRQPAKRRAALDIVDRALFVDNWYDALVAGDPYYNPGFARERADHSATGWRERVHRVATGSRR